RDRNVHVADLARLSGLARNSRDDAATVPEALDTIASACVSGMPAGVRATPSAWARSFAAALAAFQWPGNDVLASDEQQQHERFRDLVGELALLGAGGGPLLAHGEAVDLLATMARRTAFEAASEDVPVTLTDALDDPLVSYDGIWVAGLGAETWP